MPTPLCLTFVKMPGKYDALTLTRSDGTSELIRCPKQGMIPHEMVHFAVEKTLVAKGFLGRIGKGETLAPMAPTEPSEAIERIVEVLQAEVWSGAQSTEDFIALYERACAVRGHPVVPVDAAVHQALRAELSRLTALWDAVPLRGSLTLVLEAE